MAVTPHTASSVEHLQWLGIGIALTGPEQVHVGLLYRVDGGTPFFRHLAFHRQLRNDSAVAFAGEYSLHWAECSLDVDNRAVMAAYVAAVEQNPADIPFGFDSSGSAFDPETGAFYEPPIGKGLTCATYVLGMFEARGFHLLNTDGWPERAEDIEWQERIIGIVENYCAGRGLDCAEHIAAMRADVGAKRYRPEEVAAGMLSSPTPVNFPTARELADQILVDLGEYQPPVPLPGSLN